jgi:hypothetical protein
MVPQTGGRPAAAMPREWRSATLRILPYFAAPLLTLYIYWDALHSWFLLDDFVWLSQLARIHEGVPLTRLIFQPTVQGTLRPWSDRVFFLLWQSVFGLDAFPYHAWIFATQFCNFVLLTAIVRRLTGRGAAFLAPVLWTADAVLVMTMAWACLYKDILCSFFLLLAFYLFLRYVETGERRYYVWQWIVFLLGFGAMETNAVYPAIVVGYALLCARTHIRKAVLLAIPSAVYLAANFLFVKKQAAGPYAMHFDRFLPATFAQYWSLVLKPDARVGDSWTMFVLPVVTTVCLAAYVVRQWRAGRRAPVFGVLWFALAILPVLPLREQFQTYYPTVASIGLAILAASAISSAWESRTRWRWLWRALATALTVGFLIPSVRLAHEQSAVWRTRGRRAELLVTGVAAARQAHPGSAIVLDELESASFWDVVPDGGFTAAGVSKVYLAPGSSSNIERLPHAPDPKAFEIPEEALRRDAERVEVYYAGWKTLRNITRPYMNKLLSETSSALPRHLDFGDPLLDPLLRSGWYHAEEDHRWMGRQATVRMAAPRAAGESLHVIGSIPASFLAGAPIVFSATADEQALGSIPLSKEAIDVSFPLPAALAGKRAMAVTLEVDRTHRAPNDDRDLGVAIGVIEIR